MSTSTDKLHFIENELLLKKDSEDVWLTNLYRVREVLGKTQANLFKDLIAGDIILISVKVSRAGANSGRTHAKYLEIVAIADDLSTQKVWKSFNEIGSIIKNFDLEVL